ncbi:MAG: NUDIX domain-containing protein [Isosphaeraceae bacterium]
MQTPERDEAVPADPTVWIPQSVYELILQNVPIACVDIAIVASGGVLLVRRKDRPAAGEWWLPGGRVYKGEKMCAAARRKGVEEVGLECHVGPIIHTAETIFPDGPHGIPVHSINSCFLLYPINRDSEVEVRLDGHHSSYQWARKLPGGLHQYVERCLRGTGLED